ncbi:hypothetical protein E2C01_068764 [Portunus trituberculatus]|uniref:Uncharacterized protein n=1 Tax=Portunus trituberculatus TaxID=210409 RepID=A0A5B7HXF1_PORTR|nr:hypothetical protein [Portunus trituberculatus]
MKKMQEKEGRSVVLAIPSIARHARRERDKTTKNDQHLLRFHDLDCMKSKLNLTRRIPDSTVKAGHGDSRKGLWSQKVNG